MAYISQNPYQYGNTVSQMGVRPLQPATSQPGAEGGGSGPAYGSPAGIGPGSSSGPAAGTEAKPQQGTGWVNLQNLFGLNKGAAGEMVDKIASPLEQQGADISGKIEGLSGMDIPDDLRQQAESTGQRARSIATPEGQAAELKRAYGTGGAGYTKGESDLDSFLTGVAGGDRLGRIQSLYGNLSQQLGLKAEGNRTPETDNKIVPVDSPPATGGGPPASSEDPSKWRYRSRTGERTAPSTGSGAPPPGPGGATGDAGWSGYDPNQPPDPNNPYDPRNRAGYGGATGG